MSKSSQKVEWLMTWPPFLWLVLFFLIPTLVVYAMAFRPSDIYGGIGGGWTFQTFQDIWNYHYIKVISRTVWLSLLTTIISIFLALPMAYYMARASARLRNFLLLMIVLPFWSSFIVRVFAWKLLLHPEGFFKKLLIFLHFVSPDTILLYNDFSVVLVMVYTYLPFAILPLYAAAAKFDYQLFEAALDLGMDRFKIFFKVFIPCIRRGVVSALLMVLIPCLGAYIIPDVIGGSSTEMIGNKIVQRTFVDRNIPQASALSALLSMAVLIPMLLIVLVQSGKGRLRTVKGGH